jgi:hypothetical protein
MLAASSVGYLFARSPHLRMGGPAVTLLAVTPQRQEQRQAAVATRGSFEGLRAILATQGTF